VLGALVVGVVIATTAAITVWVSTRIGPANPDAGGESTPPTNTYGLASANDTGPATIITDEPTCTAWEALHNTFVNSQTKEWAERDPNIPASQWTPTTPPPTSATACRSATGDRTLDTVTRRHGGVPHQLPTPRRSPRAPRKDRIGG
jgi:hypothetical protein